MNQSGATNYQQKNEERLEINLKDLLLYLIERLPIILLVTVLFGGLAAVYSFYLYNPKYETTSKIYLVDTKKSESISNSDLQLGNSLAQDYIKVFEMKPLKDLAKDYIGKENEDIFEKTKVTPSNPSGTHMIYITASSHVPEEARLVANAYAEAACDFIEMNMSVPKPTILEQAPLNTTPSSLSRPIIIVVGSAIGLVFVCMIFTLLFMTDDRIVTEEDINKYFDISCIGVVTKHNSNKVYSQKERKRKRKKEKRINNEQRFGEKR